MNKMVNGGPTKRAMKGTLYQYRGLNKDKGLANTFDNTAQVQNLKTARVYVFGNADIDEEEVLNDEAESHELRARGRLRNVVAAAKDEENRTLTIDRPILKGETLQKIAVKYSCEVSELKRINNLLNDQDFYALTSIKVPMLKYDLARETLEEEIRQNASSLGVDAVNGAAMTLGAASGSDSILEVTEANVSDEEEWNAHETDEDQGNPLVRMVSIRKSMTSQSQEAKDFLRRMDADIKNILSSTKSSKKKNLEEVRHSLICRRIYPMNHKESNDYCSLKFGTIISIVVIVAIIAPLIYILYFKHIKPPPHSSGGS